MHTSFDRNLALAFFKDSVDDLALGLTSFPGLSCPFLPLAHREPSLLMTVLAGFLLLDDKRSSTSAAFGALRTAFFLAFVA
jgi:hypothetical protein